MMTDARHPWLAADPVAAAAAVDLGVAQLQRAEFARKHPDKCPACQGTGDIRIATVDAFGITYEKAVCGDCDGKREAV